MATYVPAGWTVGTAASTTAAYPTTWGQWTRTAVGASTATTYNTYATTNATAYTTWDRWVEVGYITEPVTWQQEIWGEWIEDEAEVQARRAAAQRRADEMQAVREQQSRERLARQQAEQERMELARERGRELLELVVDPADRVPGLDLLQFEGSDGKLYRVEMHRRTVHGNIVLVDEHGCMLGRACVAPAMYDGVTALPTEDGYVGQYLGLKFDAETFLSHANWSHRQPCHDRRGAEVAVAA